MTSTRNIAAVFGAIAAVLLLYLINPWVNPEEGSIISQVVTVGFWLSFIVLLVILFQQRKEPGGETIEIEPLAESLHLVAGIALATSRPRLSEDAPVR